jgi:hypothetical protein
MIVEEIPCGGCRLARAAEDIDERSISPVLSNDKQAVAQCLDCDHHYCADCLLEHQIDTAKSSHRLVSLKRSSVDEASVAENAEEEAVDEAEEEAQEINNNDIMFAKKMKYSKADDLAEGDEERRRLSNAGSDKIIRVNEDEDEDDDEHEEEVNETAPDSSDLNLLNDVNSEEQLLFAAQIAALSKLDPQLQQQQLQQQQQQQKALFSARSIEALRQFIEMKQLQQQQEQQQAVAATNASVSAPSVANNR